jgi:PAS domain-containing protein
LNALNRPVFKVLDGGLDEATSWSWFCGHCAAPSPGGSPPPPGARVCSSCGLGLLLETREDAVPELQDAFLVVDSALLIQALSAEAQALLAVDEEEAVGRPVSELLVPADAESQARTGFAASIVRAAEGAALDSGQSFVRPWNTFGVRMRARVATCGPPRAALVVLESRPRPRLRAV